MVITVQNPCHKKQQGRSLTLVSFQSALHGFAGQNSVGGNSHANNRKVWRNLTDTFPHPYTLATAEHWLSIANADPRSVHLAIELHGQAVGGVGAIAGSGISVATADFGYWLGEALWGRGLATAAASAFKEHLVQSKRFARLQAPVFAWNPASMRVLEKVGFVREGVLHNSVTKDGALIDSVMYACTAA